MKKTNFIATIAVALIAGMSIFVACTKEKQANTGSIPKYLYENCEYSYKLTASDSIYQSTTYGWSGVDYYVRELSTSDTTLVYDFYFSDENAVSFSVDALGDIEYNKSGLTDLVTVKLKNIVFDEENYTMTFDYTINGVVTNVCSLQLNNSDDFDDLESYVDGTLVTAPPILKELGKMTLAYLFGCIIDTAVDQIGTAADNAANDCYKHMRRQAESCISAGGLPYEIHTINHFGCSLECRARPNNN